MPYFHLPFEIHIGCGMMQVQNHLHSAKQVWRFIVYVIQHHVKVLPLKYTVRVS